ncbi:MAG: hypothetical protein U9Q78_01155 [Chloroflexota bacterium]|nr:hypothetical protein [Chloroflexota bacterium]
MHKEKGLTFKAIGTYFMVLLLWVVSSAIGLFGLIQTYEAARVVAGVLMPINPLETVASQGRVVVIARTVLILGSVAWLAGVILLLFRYYQAATSEEPLWRPFAKTMVIELVILGLTSGVTYYGHRIFRLLKASERR